jgi:putative hydrolase of the HAD superfamily
MIIKAVAFDYGGVISAPQAPGTMARLARMAGVDAEALESLIWARRGDYDRGKVPGTEYFARALGAMGRSLDAAALGELVRVDLESWATLDSGTLALIEDVEASGRKTAILSNMPREFLALARERFPLFSRVDAGIYSCEVGANKPEPAIYEALVAALGFEPGEIAFFDDVTANVEGALTIGIRAALWRGAADGRRRLAELGIGLKAFSP